MDYLGFRKLGANTPAPKAYIKMLYLPERGWSWSEVKKLTLAEEEMLFYFLAKEAEYEPEKS